MLNTLQKSSLNTWKLTPGQKRVNAKYAEHESLTLKLPELTASLAVFRGHGTKRHQFGAEQPFSRAHYTLPAQITCFAARKLITSQLQPQQSLHQIKFLSWELHAFLAQLGFGKWQNRWANKFNSIIGWENHEEKCSCRTVFCPGQRHTAHASYTCCGSDTSLQMFHGSLIPFLFIATAKWSTEKQKPTLLITSDQKPVAPLMGGHTPHSQSLQVSGTLASSKFPSTTTGSHNTYHLISRTKVRYTSVWETSHSVLDWNKLITALQPRICSRILSQCDSRKGLVNQKSSSSNLGWKPKARNIQNRALEDFTARNRSEDDQILKHQVN